MKGLSSKYVRLTIAIAGIAIIFISFDSGLDDSLVKMVLFIIGLIVLIISGILWYREYFSIKK